MARWTVIGLLVMVWFMLGACSGGASNQARGGAVDDDGSPPLIDDDAGDDDTVAPDDDTAVDDDSSVDDDTTPTDDDTIDDDTVDDDTVDDDIVDDDTVDDDTVDDDTVDDDTVDDDTIDDDTVDDDTVDDDTVDDDTVDDDTTPELPTVEIIEPQDGQTYYSNDQPVTIAISNVATATVELDGNDVTDQLIVGSDYISGTVDGVSAGEHTLAVSVENPVGYDYDEAGFTTEIADPYLDLTLSHYAAQVGTEVEREVHVYDEMGNDVTAQVELTLNVAPGTGFEQNGDLFTFTEPGLWTFGASCTYNGNELSDSEQHRAYDDIPDRVALSLSAHTVQAGGTIIANYVVYNAFDQELPDYPVQIDVIPGDGVTVDGKQITFTIVGDYQVTVNPAGYPEILDSDTLNVRPGPPISIDLQVTDNSVDAGQNIGYSVILLDQYGNAWTSGWNMVANPNTGVVIDTVNQTIYFGIAGNFTITASFYLMNDHEHVAVTDHVPPTLEWTAPPRGTFTQAPTVTLEGNVADVGGTIAYFKINNQDVPVQPNGHFALPQGLYNGYNFFQAVVKDNSGNTTNSSISVLRGSYLANDTWVANAAGARVNDSGLDKVEDIAELYLNTLFDLEQLVFSYNPLLNENFDLGFISCSVFAAATAVQNDPIQLLLDAKNGYIDAQVALNNFSLTVGFSIECSKDGADTIYEGTVSADWIRAQVPIYAEVVDNQLAVTLGDVLITNQDLELTVTGIDPLLTEMLIEALWPVIEDMVNELVQEEIPPLLERLLSDLELAFSFELLGHTITLDANFNDLDILDTGLNLWMNARTTADAYDPNTPQHLGSFFTAGSLPSFGALTPSGLLYELGVALGDDVLNQALMVLYRSGILTMELGPGSAFPLELQAGDLELFFPGISDLAGPDAPVVIQLLPKLPPILVLDPAKAAGIELQMGEFFFDITVQPETGDPLPVMSMVIALRAPLVVDANETGDKLSVEIGAIATYLDITQSMSILPDAFFETFIPTLLQFVVPFISHFLEDFPIPVFEGFTINISEITVIGFANDFLSVYGDLVQMPKYGW